MDDVTTDRAAKDWPRRRANFRVRCLTDPTPEQLDEIAAYVKANMFKWEKMTQRPFTRKVSGMEIAIEDAEAPS